MKRRYQNGCKQAPLVRLLANDGKELKLRIEEKATQLSDVPLPLNDHPDVEYANFSQGIDLDDPELYLRVKDGKNASKLISDLCSSIVDDFSNLKI